MELSVRYLSWKPLWSQASNALFFGCVSGKCWITAMIAASCSIEAPSFFTCNLLEMCFLHEQGLGQTHRWLVMLTDNGDVNVEIGTPSQTPTSLSSQALIPTLLTHLNPSSLPWCPCFFFFVFALVQELLSSTKPKWYSGPFLPYFCYCFLFIYLFFCQPVDLVLSIRCLFKCFPV